MTLYKQVGRKRVALTAEEERELREQWARNDREYQKVRYSHERAREYKKDIPTRNRSIRCNMARYRQKWRT